jgi:hypothetical protein
MKPISSISNRSSFSLAHLFLTVTLVGVYLACFRWSEGAAMLLLAISVPVIIRTILAQDKFRHLGLPLTARQTLAVAGVSLFGVFVAYLVGAVGFVTTCLLFGVLAALFGVGIGLGDLWVDSMIFGSLMGMVLGMAGGILSGCAVTFLGWQIPEKVVQMPDRSRPLQSKPQESSVPS